MLELNWLPRFDTQWASLWNAANYAVSRIGAPLDNPITPDAKGLLKLSHWIDEIARLKLSPEDETMIIDGLGTLLGCVLMHHIGRGEWVFRDDECRLRFGKYQWFNPFRAIEHALDTEPARLALIDDVALAEKEAAGKGPLARVLHAFDAQLREVCDLEITDNFLSRVWLDGGVEVDLAATVKACASESDATLRNALNKVINLLPGNHTTASESWSEVQMRVMPRLVGATHLEALTKRFGEQELLTYPLNDGLYMSWVVRYTKQARYITRADLARWQVELSDVAACATTNLELVSSKLSVKRVDNKPLWMIRSGDGLASSRLVLRSFAERISSYLGFGIALSVPHRDVLLIGNRNDAESMAALQSETITQSAAAPHAICASAYAWQSGKLTQL